jgi:hypothetical protein
MQKLVFILIAFIAAVTFIRAFEKNAAAPPLSGSAPGKTVQMQDE